MRRLRPEHRHPDPADRLTWAAGDAAQRDLWFPPRKISIEDDSKVLLLGVKVADARRGYVEWAADMGEVRSWADR